MQVVKRLVGKNFLYAKTLPLAGTQFTINVVTPDAVWAEERIGIAANEIKRVDRLLTTLHSDSQLNLVNRNAGLYPVKVNGELFRLIGRLQEIAEFTQGAFDVTYGAFAGYRNIKLNAVAGEVFLTCPETRLYFGGIAAAYAIDQAKYVLQLNGVSSGAIQAGEVVSAWGWQPNGQEWTIGAADNRQALHSWANVLTGNLATAGCDAGDAPVRLLAPGAVLAVALVKPVHQLGRQDGLSWVDNMQQVACLFAENTGWLYPSRHVGFGR